MTVTDFLLACIAEDEAAARACGSDPADGSPVQWIYDRANDEALAPFKVPDLPDGVIVRNYQFRDPMQEGDWIIAAHWEEDGEHIARHDPARVLAECEAKRAIVERCGRVAGDAVPSRMLAHHVLQDLAQVYRDRPGWREEWAL